MKKTLIPFVLLFFTNLCIGQSQDFIYTPTCYGSQTTLVGSSTYLDSEIQSWQWDVNGDGTYELTGKTIIYLFTSSDTVSVTLKVTPNTGSADSIKKNVIIDPLPNVNFRVDNLCANKQATYYNLSTILTGSIDQFLWDFDNNGVTDDFSNDTVFYTCGPAQTYQTKLTCVSDKGCSAFAIKTTEVFPQPQASYTVSNTCSGDSTVFINTSNISSLDFYLWDFGDGTASSNVSPKHKFTSAGNYNISLVASTIHECRDTSNFNTIDINSSPVASITSQNNDTLLNENEAIMLSATPNGATSYAWSNSLSGQNITVFNEGTYIVTVTDQNGCQGTASIHITKSTTPEFSLASNILTPNGDDVNDNLMINNISIYGNVSLEVFNIWNDNVFSSNNYNNDWKGFGKNGNRLPDGAYYYIIKYGEQTIKGVINILSTK